MKVRKGRAEMQGLIKWIQGISLSELLCEQNVGSSTGIATMLTGSKSLEIVAIAIQVIFCVFNPILKELYCNIWIL